MKKLNISFFLPLIVFITAGLSLSSCKDTLDMPIEEAKKYNPKDDPYMEVCKHASKVANLIVTDYYNKCNSIEELAEYLEEIKSLDYIEDAYCTSNSLFVRIKNYGTLSYSYFPKAKTISKLSSFSMKEAMTRSSSNIHTSFNSLGLKNSIVVNTTAFDETFSFQNSMYSEMNKYFKSVGIDTLTNYHPTVDFFEKEIGNYDIVFLITHGCYDHNSKRHWLLTSEEKKEFNENVLYDSQDLVAKEQITFNYHSEIRNGKDYGYWAVLISDKFISDISLGWSGIRKGKPVIFNVACQSLMGEDPNNKNDDNLPDYNLADAFIDKGAGVYVGFDESNSIGGYTGLLFFSRLLSGMSFQRAYDTLPEEFCHEEDKRHLSFLKNRHYVADLLIHYPINFTEIKNSTIFFQLEADLNSVDNVLTGFAPLRLTNIKTEELELYEDYSDSPYNSFRYGFEISEFESFDSFKRIGSMSVEDNNCFISEGNISFSQPLSFSSLSPETTYYYRAYFFDGEEYYYSDIDSFTTPKKGSGNTEDPKDTGDTTNNAQTQNVPGSDL